MNRHLLTIAPLLLFASLASCKVDDPNKNADDSTDACSGPKITTVSDDQSVALGSVVSLAVDGTVCDDGEKTFTWTMESHPVDSVMDTTDINTTDPTAPTFTPDVVGTYALSVVLSDAAGELSAVEYVVVTVSASNSAPIADCGPNLSADIHERVDFDGSDSRDPEGAALEYSWAVSSVPECSALTPGAGSIFNGDSVNPSMVPDCAGTFVVALSVSDGEQWSDDAYCSVVVANGNEPPVADAGQSEALSPCTNQAYELDGYGSYDPEGAPLTYWWSLVSAPAGSSTSDASFSDQSQANPTFTWDVTGSYTFQLQVNDGVNASAPDIVTFTFSDTTANNAPIANAGSDKTISNEPECSTASYVFACDDCPSDDVTLDGSASDDPIDGDELSFLWTDASAELTIESAYSPVTRVYTPSFPSEYNVAQTKTWEVMLSVSDCADSDTDSVTITYNCTGTYTP